MKINGATIHATKTSNASSRHPPSRRRTIERTKTSKAPSAATPDAVDWLGYYYKNYKEVQDVRIRLQNWRRSFEKNHGLTKDLVLHALHPDAEIKRLESAYATEIRHVFHPPKSAEKMHYPPLQSAAEKAYEFLSSQKGIGDGILSAAIIRLRPWEFRSVGGMWKTFGFHVVNGKAPKRKRGQKLDHSIKKKTLVYMAVEAMIKQKGPWYARYLELKAIELAKHGAAAKECDPKNSWKAHVHRRACRRLAKEVLRDLWRSTHPAIMKVAIPTVAASPDVPLDGATNDRTKPIYVSSRRRPSRRRTKQSAKPSGVTSAATPEE